MACHSGKVPYPASGEAHRALEQLRKRTGDRRAHVYRCPCCPSWHVGTNRFEEGGERTEHLRFNLHKRRGKRDWSRRRKRKVWA